MNYAMLDPSNPDAPSLDAERLFRREGRVVGYHGTSRAATESILGTQEFKLSTKDWEWLGHGVYFWEGPARAWDWASERFGGEGRVLFATIQLRRCIDLTDATAWKQVFSVAYQYIRAAYETAGQELPENRAKARYLDCMIFNFVAYVLKADTVRAVALEGEKLFEGTEHRTQQHIQICVKTQDCIERPIKILGESHGQQTWRH